MPADLRRANIGCGSIQPEGWSNFDHDHQYVGPNCRFLRLPTASGLQADVYDYIVCSFMMQELDHHQIPAFLQNVRTMLKPGGVFRVMVPNLLSAFDYYFETDEEWFPQDERTGDLDAKFCTYVTWFGTVRSVFTPAYLQELLSGAFESVMRCDYGMTGHFRRYPGITDLDSRPKESLIFEAQKQ